MKKKLKFATIAIFSSITLLAACGETTKNEADNSTVQSQKAEAEKPEQQYTKGQEMANVLSSTNWQGTRVYNQDNDDLTKENAGFIGLAKYEANTGRYEFFDAETGKTRGDEGTFFMTNDGTKRILISDTMKYQAVVEITELEEEIFTYKRMGKDAEGKDVEVFVEHIPYDENELAFTNPNQELSASTGDINTNVDGDKILSKTLWQGTKAFDEEGNDVTKYNEKFLSVAKFEEGTNQYEFFNIETGESRGDYGYFDVIHDNKIRAHVSIGDNKYGAALELTELNDDKFTYKRVGKNADGKDSVIFVEHEPYKGDFKPSFSF